MNYKNQFEQTKQEWINFQKIENNKKIRIRDAAIKLNTSEAELLSTKIGSKVSFLKIDFDIFFEKILEIDKIMLLTRNDILVHEVVIHGNQLSKVNDSIIYCQKKHPLLSINFNQIKYSFYEQSNHGKKELHSFQFFDKAGESILKIYLKGNDLEKFRKIKSNYEIEYNYDIQKIIKEKKNQKKINFDIDYEFSQENNSRFDTIKYSTVILRQFLEYIVEIKIPVQIHGIGNNTIQYFYGKIKNIIDFGPWINIIDKEFNLHALEKEIKFNTINRYCKNGKNYFSIEFYDNNNSHILGISSLKLFPEKFEDILKKIGVLKSA